MRTREMKDLGTITATGYRAFGLKWDTANWWIVIQWVTAVKCKANNKINNGTVILKGEGRVLVIALITWVRLVSRDQKRFTIWEVAADWHELMTPQPSIAHIRQWMAAIKAPGK